ncbi:MAG: ribosome-associated translation inhibitor RaiA [Spirochaetota bacterium]
MNIDVRSVHFDLGEVSREYLDKKLERIGYAKDLIVDLIFIFTKDKDFKCEVTVNFRWGTQAHIEEREYDIAAGIDKLVDRLEQKITKEKDKVQERK